MPIPSEISKADLLLAMEKLDAGTTSEFGMPTKYFVEHDHRYYAPKALVGMAVQIATGKTLLPSDFSSGLDSNQAVGFLRKYGLTVVDIDQLAAEVDHAKGYLLHADEAWLNFHRANSIGGTAVYAREAGAPIKNLSPGSPVFCIMTRHAPHHFYLAGIFQECRILSRREAWATYEYSLGSDSFERWRELGGWPLTEADKPIAVIVLTEVSMPSVPVPITGALIETRRSPKGRTLRPDEVSRIIKCWPGSSLVPPISHANDPLEIHSWTLIGDAVATKRLDKSSFKYHGTGIPGDIRPFFQAETLGPGDKKDIELQFAGKAIPAYIQIDPLDRARLFWDPSFTSMLKGALPGWAEALNADVPLSDANRPIMRFARAERGDAFIVAIVCPESIRMDAEAEQEEEQGPRAEGAVKVYYGKRYERDPKNRSRAIEIHGEKCVVCGFDFGRAYGARGAGFIEVHHTKPLHTVDGEHEVNPETDLMPVCANCHRILHRRKDDVLSIDDLKAVLRP